MNWAAGVILISKKTRRLALALRSNQVSNPYTFSAIGGHVDKGESPQDAVVRESKEEFGLDIDPKGLLPLDVLKKIGIEYWLFGYFIDEEINPRPKDNENVRLEWRHYSQWNNLHPKLKESWKKYKVKWRFNNQRQWLANIKMQSRLSHYTHPYYKSNIQPVIDELRSVGAKFGGQHKPDYTTFYNLLYNPTGIDFTTGGVDVFGLNDLMECHPKWNEKKSLMDNLIAIIGPEMEGEVNNAFEEGKIKMDNFWCPPNVFEIGKIDMEAGDFDYWWQKFGHSGRNDWIVVCKWLDALASGKDDPRRTGDGPPYRRHDNMPVEPTIRERFMAAKLLHQFATHISNKRKGYDKELLEIIKKYKKMPESPPIVKGAEDMMELTCSNCGHLIVWYHSYACGSICPKSKGGCGEFIENPKHKPYEIDNYCYYESTCDKCNGEKQTAAMVWDYGESAKPTGYCLDCLKKHPPEKYGDKYKMLPWAKDKKPKYVEEEHEEDLLSVSVGRDDRENIYDILKTFAIVENVESGMTQQQWIRILDEFEQLMPIPKLQMK